MSVQQEMSKDFSVPVLERRLELNMPRGFFSAVHDVVMIALELIGAKSGTSSGWIHVEVADLMAEVGSLVFRRVDGHDVLSESS